MALKTTTFDPAKYLDDPDAIAGYLSDAFETEDVAFIADALGVVARAKSMTKIAREANLSRESLYRSLSTEGNPELGTLVKVMSVLGLRLQVSPIEHEESEEPEIQHAQPAA